MIVTEDSVDYFASYETIKGSNQVMSIKLFLSEFLNAGDTKSKLMSCKGTAQLNYKVTPFTRKKQGKTQGQFFCIAYTGLCIV